MNIIRVLYNSQSFISDYMRILGHGRHKIPFSIFSPLSTLLLISYFEINTQLVNWGILVLLFSYLGCLEFSYSCWCIVFFSNTFRDYHCGLIGYQQTKKIPAPPVLNHGGLQPVIVNHSSPATDIPTPRASPVGFSPDPGGPSSLCSAGRPVVTALSAPNTQNSPTMADSSAHSKHGQLLGKYGSGFQSGLFKECLYVLSAH